MSYQYVILQGRGPDGKPKAVAVDADGKLIISGGGGGGGDASAENQSTQIDQLADILSEITGAAKDTSVQAVTAAIEALADNATIADVVQKLSDDAATQASILAELQAQGVDIDASATKLVEIETAVDDLETINAAIRDRIDPVWTAASTGTVGAKSARVLTLFGRRTVSTFVNATQYHDLVSYATADAAVADMTGTEALEIVSSSINDTAAGTAARTIKIWYIDALAGDVESTTTVTLNGTTPVALGAGIRAKNIQWMELRTAGSANHNEGTITLRTAGAGTTWEQIPALQRRSFSARYMVPANAVAYVKSPRFSAIAQRMDFALLANESEDGTSLGSVYIPHHPATLPANSTSPVIEAPDHKFSAGTRLKFAAITAATASNPTASAEFTVLQVAI